MLTEVESGKVVGVAGVKPFVVVGVPAVNEEKTIARVVLEAQKYADRVVVCDDGSTDLTAKIAERLGADVVRREQNGGKGKALKTLFAEIVKLKPDVVVTLDADGQHDAREIPKLIKPIICGEGDVVVGSRYAKNLKNDIPLYRQVGLAVINWFSRGVSKLDVNDTQNGFRAYSFKAFKTIVMHESRGYAVESEQLILAGRAGLKIIEVPVSVKYADLDRTSKKSPLIQGLGIIGFILRKVIEERPLLFLGLPGIASLLIGTIYGVWLLHVYAVEHYIVTNIALASIGFMMIGFFCMSVAITLYAITRLAEKIKREK